MTHGLKAGLNGHAHRNGAGGPTAAPLPPSADGMPQGGAGGPTAAPLPPSADGMPQGGKDPATGKFLPGNRCGRGNPHYRRLAANRTAFLEAAGPEQVKALAAKLLEKALAGDVEAARLVLGYAIGRPQPAADPDRADLEEWRLLDSWPTLAQFMRALVDGADAGVAAGLLRERLGAMGRDEFVKRAQDRQEHGLGEQVVSERARRCGKGR